MYTEVWWVVWQSRQVQSTAWASIIVASDCRSPCNDQQYDLEPSHLYTHMYIHLWTESNSVGIGIEIVGRLADLCYVYERHVSLLYSQ